MTALQDIIPGCNKVLVSLSCQWCSCCYSSSLEHSTRYLCLIQIIGKALVLDEIINYIQSLQRQVEVKQKKNQIITSSLLQCCNIDSFCVYSFCQ